MGAIGMIRITKKLAIAFATLVLGSTAGFAQQGPATLVVPQLGEPKTLSPNFASDSLGFAPSSNVYSHLVAIDWGVNKGTGAYGDLAESWTTSERRQDRHLQADQERKVA